MHAGAATARDGLQTAPAAAGPLSEEAGDGEYSSDDEDSITGPSDTGNDDTALKPVPELAPLAMGPAAVLETIPVNASLGSYDDPITLPVIPVAIAVLPSGKVS
jgi:hypothetical protein